MITLTGRNVYAFVKANVNFVIKRISVGYIVFIIYDYLCVEVKCQLDATDDIYSRFYCFLNMFRAPLCPSSGAREYYTDGRCLWYFVLWLSSCRYGVELRVMCPVCDTLTTKAPNTTGSDHLYNTLELLMMGIMMPETY